MRCSLLLVHILACFLFSAAALLQLLGTIDPSTSTCYLGPTSYHFCKRASTACAWMHVLLLLQRVKTHRCHRESRSAPPFFFLQNS
ncbi:hypothetical protein HDV63DRAFT_364062, partial [Trichoderma sp. SZMC 28014]